MTEIFDAFFSIYDQSVFLSTDNVAINTKKKISLLRICLSLFAYFLVEDKIIIPQSSSLILKRWK